MINERILHRNDKFYVVGRIHDVGAIKMVKTKNGDTPSRKIVVCIEEGQYPSYIVIGMFGEIAEKPLAPNEQKAFAVNFKASNQNAKKEWFGNINAWAIFEIHELESYLQRQGGAPIPQGQYYAPPQPNYGAPQPNYQQQAPQQNYPQNGQRDDYGF